MIRFAKKEDGAAVAKLILVILKDMELDFLAEFGEEKALEVITACFEDPTYRFGYARGLVEEIDGEIAGAVFGYPANKEKIIDLPLKIICVHKEFPTILRCLLILKLFLVNGIWIQSQWMKNFVDKGLVQSC